jgi:hypothetical protein
MIHCAWLLLVPLAGLLGLLAASFLKGLQPCCICDSRPAAYCADCVMRAAQYHGPNESLKGGAK